MSVFNVIENAKVFFSQTFNAECDVISVKEENSRYVITVEAIVDQEYTKRKALPDVVAQYVLYMDNKGEICEYERKELRKRFDLL